MLTGVWAHHKTNKICVFVSMCVCVCVCFFLCLRERENMHFSSCLEHRVLGCACIFCIYSFTIVTSIVGLGFCFSPLFIKCMKVWGVYECVCVFVCVGVFWQCRGAECRAPIVDGLFSHYFRAVEAGCPSYPRKYSAVLKTSTAPRITHINNTA